MVWGQFLALIRVCWSKVSFGHQKWTGWAQTHDFGLILSVFDVFGPILSTFDDQNSLLTNKLESALKIGPKPYTDPKVGFKCFRSHLRLTFGLGWHTAQMAQNPKNDQLRFISDCAQKNFPGVNRVE